MKHRSRRGQILKASILTVLFFGLISCSSDKSDSIDQGAKRLEKRNQSLLQAIKKWNEAKVKKALQEGANPNKIYNYQGSTITPTIVAGAIGTDEIYDLLIQKGGDPDFSYKGFTASEFNIQKNLGGE